MPFPWRGPVDVSFFLQPTNVLAKALLGTVLVHDTPEGLTAGRIVEVEMYQGPWDKAAHSYGGRMTERTRIMYEDAGHAYVYFIYGMHYCLNVVSGPHGAPEAILIRALEPLEGLELMAQRRRLAWPRKGLCELTNGPGKLAQAMGITKRQYGWHLAHSALRLYHDQDPLPDNQLATGPRINVNYAEEAALYPWRFWVAGHACLSVKNRA
ncbi:MAG: DNA-3-methyladenine glycosylase [Sulfobacillus thermosulfidooxidans]|uniref:Putative 3-methyladenine DNA glycosylase n=2 Tax=Clostridiales Family XVII. Incertae Sedis TaxID=539000 RepID=A0ABM6RRA6_9FIRM|nr:DNA-3-methyladenine glycosylase [Sulfobacillus sp. hq2]AUW93975.1 3-methyladenine DNA glycosylase [Sulfobacillus thermotolerans]MCY0907630.1 DNA-3-methyladenine glycosylase [Sulfobacillus thermotolerans]POB11920.1 3-methyladenine DNA glycosylase [Sulfobacillus sp. hq2]PSR36365.1 MAG: DNA-3-methyladenine glycosylase [Sulfobacillus thermosulfidooxidans]